MHEYEPVVFEQVPTLEVAPQMVVFVVHSFTSAHVTPSPPYPFWQVHVREPGVFEHVAYWEQPPLFARHSLTSLQLFESLPSW